MAEPENEAIDGEYAAREWLKGCAGVAAHVGTRVYFGLPRKTTPTWPLITAQRMGGFNDGQGHETVRFSVISHATTKHDASAIALEVCRYLQAEEYFPKSVAGYSVRSGGMDSITEIANLGEDIRRYLVSAWLIVRKETA